jgi:cob(I)alamin adenosyltransferase
MVYLSRIYTKSGDRGDTGLGDGTRVPKDHPRVVAYGSVDELNAVLGLLVSSYPQASESELVRSLPMRNPAPICAFVLSKWSDWRKPSIG